METRRRTTQKAVGVVFVIRGLSTFLNAYGRFGKLCVHSQEREPRFESDTVLLLGTSGRLQRQPNNQRSGICVQLRYASQTDAGRYFYAIRYLSVGRADGSAHGDEMGRQDRQAPDGSEALYRSRYFPGNHGGA